MTLPSPAAREAVSPNAAWLDCAVSLTSGMPHESAAVDCQSARSVRAAAANLLLSCCVLGVPTEASGDGEASSAARSCQGRTVEEGVAYSVSVLSHSDLGCDAGEVASSLPCHTGLSLDVAVLPGELKACEPDMLWGDLCCSRL